MKKLIALMLSLVFVISLPLGAAAADLGAENENPAFRIILETSNKCLKAGTVTTIALTLLGIEPEAGISGFQFEMYYNPDQLKLVNDLDEFSDNVVACSLYAPNIGWENLTHVNHTIDSEGNAIPTNDGKITISAICIGINPEHNAKDDGSINMLFKFEIASDVQGPIEAYIRHEDATAFTNTETGMEHHLGEGATALIKTHVLPENQFACEGDIICTECGGVAVEAISHKFTNYTSNGDATCTSDGTKAAECDFGCGRSSTVADVGSKLDHEFADYIPNGDATRLEDGTKTAECELGCGTTDTITDEGTAIGVKLGDVTLNDSVNASDYSLVKRYVLGRASITDPAALVAADVNRDGSITAMDYSYIKRGVLGTYILEYYLP